MRQQIRSNVCLKALVFEVELKFNPGMQGRLKLEKSFLQGTKPVFPFYKKGIMNVVALLSFL